jgi:ABC-2 type transport system permease protein
MNKILLVLRNELVTILSRRSFWLTALGIPILGALVFSGVGAINRSAAASETIGQVFATQQETGPEGYVDLSGIIKKVPTEIPAGTFVAYTDETAARQALQEGKISAFYIVSKSYLEDGKITYVRPDFNPMASSNGRSSDFTWILQTNLVGGNAKLASLVNGPRKLTDENLVPASEPNQENPMTTWTPYFISILFYGLIMGASSLLLSSVSKEKENRIIEVLLTSVKPRQLLTGKIIGLGIAGLGQTIIWIGTSYVLLSLSGSTFKLPFQIHLPLSFITWGLVFFLLGYAVYASLMAGLGALVPNLREASQATIIIMIPMMIPMMLSNSVFAMQPHGAIATVLSLFPLSAPVAMMARISAGGVPWWQLPLAAALMALTALFILRAVAGMFRAQALLSGQAFNVKRYFRALAGKEQ